MITKDKLIKTLDNDIRKTEKKLINNKTLKIKGSVCAAIIGLGIGVDSFLPFCLGSLTIGGLNAKFNNHNLPFKADTFTEHANVQTIDTSDGKHMEFISYDCDYDKGISCEHTTGWKKIYDGTYERTVTRYKLNENVDLSNFDSILSMSKEELEKVLEVSNVETINKRKLDTEDVIYNDECIVIIDNFISDTYIKKNKESTNDVLLHSFLYIVVASGLGCGLYFLKKRYLDEKIRDNLIVAYQKVKPLSKREIEELNIILKLKKQNLAMLVDDKNNNEEFSYQLSRKFKNQRRKRRNR